MITGTDFLFSFSLNISERQMTKSFQLKSVDI